MWNGYSGGGFFSRKIGHLLSLMTLRRYLSFVAVSKVRGCWFFPRGKEERISVRSRFQTRGCRARRKNMLLIRQAVVSEAAMKAWMAPLRSWSRSWDCWAMVSRSTGRGRLLLLLLLFEGSFSLK